MYGRADTNRDKDEGSSLLAGVRLLMQSVGKGKTETGTKKSF
jgi:hypothetical protein